MRKIKFRAWYEGDKDGDWKIEPQMCEVWGWERTSKDYDTLKIKIASKKRIGTAFLSVPLFIKKVENYVHPLQFTGLYDKNGKEIYEGDIVKTNDGIIGEIKWDGYGFINILAVYPTYQIEVIGNIYENPELLEKK